MKTKPTLFSSVLLLAFLASANTFAFYNPQSGRWLSRDSAGEDEGGPNVYAFSGNNPVGQVDNLGLAFYAIDGTWTSASAGANPWELYMDASENPKRYYRGPRDGPVGGDSYLIVLNVKHQICEDYCAAIPQGKNFTINMTGWSRGAICVIGVANLLNDLGCNCCGTTYKPVPVNWIGLFDAVAMTPGKWWPKAVPSNVLQFDHAIKTKKMRLYPTTHFTGGTEQKFYRNDFGHSGEPTSHTDIGMSEILQNNDSYNWIKSQAISAGVAFGL